jgi:cyclopropane fatty-acyl-phospholipid synthase-like methyltransferase
MADGPNDLLEDFDAYYRIVDEPVMRRIERTVTGSDYGASSYTTLRQADRLAQLLHLAPGRRLLDFGCGAGWPGIYLARSTGCEVVLTDLPLEGLRRAERRMQLERVSGGVIAAPAGLPPLRDQAFDAATSSDVLC